MVKLLNDISIDTKKLISQLEDELFSLHKLRAKIGAELEFYLIHQNEDEAAALEKISTKCARVDKERGWQQHECVLDYTPDLLTLAEQITELKSHIAVSARQHGIKALFDAKPFDNDYGSALHLHISLHDALGVNVFSDGTYEENKYLQNVIAGILETTEESVFLLCDNDNDFKRFQEYNFLAPTHISWGGNNRSTIVRIPDSKPKYRRVEFRLPPANSDPFLAIAALLFGALYGLNNKSTPPIRTFGNAFDETYQLKPLPQSLESALNIFNDKGNLAKYVKKFAISKE